MEERFWIFVKSALFCAEAFLISTLLTGMLRKKEKYLPRVCVFAVLFCAVIGIDYFLTVRTDLPVVAANMITTFLIYAFLTGMVCLLLQGTVCSKLFFLNVACVTVFLASHLGTFCEAILNRLMVFPENGGWAFLTYYLAEVPSAAIVIFLFRKLYSGDEEHYTYFLHGFLCVFFMAGTIGLLFFEWYIRRYSLNYYIIFCFCEVFFGLIMLFLVYALMKQGEAELELSLMKQLWQKDRKHYELQKETIDIINIKCHDMRHQIRQLESKEHISPQVIKELENSITIYESIVKTGNEVLDVLISDCFLRCQKSGIQFTYMSDAKLLESLEEMDVYSLFGNILDNAIEYEQTVEPENRFISLSIRKRDKGVGIHAENFYTDAPPVIRDGIVETTKSDKTMHGFGMRSIKNIVGKYHGKLVVLIEDDMFQVDVYLPYGKDGRLRREEKTREEEL